MAQLSDELLKAALSFAAARLRDFATAACQSTADFADTFGLPHAATIAAASHLTNARNQLDAATAALTAANFETAANALGAFFKAVDAALSASTWPGGNPNPGLQGVFDRIRIRAATTSGLVRQLGLPALPASADDFTIKGGDVVFKVSESGATSLSGPAGSRLELGPRSLSARLRLTSPDGPLFGLSLALSDAKVSLAGDVSAALSGGGGGARADVTLGVDTDRGLTVGGSPHARITLPAQATIAGLDIRGLVVEVPKEDPSAFDLGAELATSIGPATLVIDGAGVRVHIDPGAIAAGQSPIQLGPLAPSGIGLSLDTGAASGGGFLERRGNEFGGTFDLRLGPVGVHGAGLLTIGGPTGFALIIVMSVEFTPAIEIALGATLNAVGGLIGIRHIIDTDALAAELRSGALGYLLFPRDPASAAPAILATLSQTFPLRRDGFVIGPMVKVGWGRPISFITASLGLVLSLPDPKVVILGQFRLAVPAPEAAIIDLRGDMFGEFSGERVLLKASLIDSRIGMFSVAGDAGALLRFGSSPDFAISAGGFYPGYSPPPELAGMRRLSIDMSPPLQLRLRAEAYVALTTNSVQAGASVELSARVGPISAEGHLNFDAIIDFVRFRFVADLTAGVSVRFKGFPVGGVDLHMRLEGPAPWRVQGTATFEFMGFEKDLDVGPLTWGPSPPPEPPIAHPRDEIVAALSNPEAWRTELPPGAERLVRLRDGSADGVALVHPLATFEGRQRVAPLETPIARIGRSAVPAGESVVGLGAPLMNATTAGAFTSVDDLFAPGQFLDLTDDQRISRPSFEPMMAGLRFASTGIGQFDIKRARESVLKYETFVADEENAFAKSRPQLIGAIAFNQASVLRANAIGRSAMAETRRYDTEAEPIALADSAMTLVRSARDLSVQAGVSPQPMSYTHAAQAIAEAARSSPGLAGSLQLVRVGVAP